MASGRTNAACSHAATDTGSCRRVAYVVPLTRVRVVPMTLLDSSMPFPPRTPCPSRTGLHRPRRFAVALLTLALPLVLGSIGSAQTRVEHPEAGIAITRPAGWHTGTVAQVQANRARTKLSDPELEVALATRAAMPLIVFTKYEEPHPGLNPSIQITLRHGLPGSPVELLGNALAVMRRGFPDLTIVEPVRQTTVDGLPAAQVRVTYTLKTHTGLTARVSSRLWLVPRGALMFLIGMSGTEAGADMCESECAGALTSLSIAR